MTVAAKKAEMTETLNFMMTNLEKISILKRLWFTKSRKITSVSTKTIKAT